jgi:uncharacterized alpha-E superfamily protein
MRKSAALFERSLLASLDDRESKLGGHSVAAVLSALRTTAFAVRERLALEQWTLVSQSEQELHAALANKSVSVQSALRALERLTVHVMAMNGAQADRMTRDDGWRMLSIGRQIERLGTLSHALAEAFATGAVDTDTGFGLVLGFFDSTITYRSRYLQRRDAQSLIELLVLDRDNPRSLAWISQTLRSRLAKLVGTPMGETPELLRERTLPHQWSQATFDRPLADLAGGDSELLIDDLKSVIDEVSGLSDVLSQRYFSHAQSSTSVGTTF